jgi:hypothetical protein
MTGCSPTLAYRERPSKKCAGLPCISWRGATADDVPMSALAYTLTGGQRFSLSAAATSGPAGETAFVDDSKAGPDKSGRAIEGRPLTIPCRRVLDVSLQEIVYSTPTGNPEVGKAARLRNSRSNRPALRAMTAPVASAGRQNGPDGLHVSDDGGLSDACKPVVTAEQRLTPIDWSHTRGTLANVADTRESS